MPLYQPTSGAEIIRAPVEEPSLCTVFANVDQGDVQIHLMSANRAVKVAEGVGLLLNDVPLDEEVTEVRVTPSGGTFVIVTLHPRIV